MGGSGAKTNPRVEKKKIFSNSVENILAQLSLFYGIN